MESSSSPSPASQASRSTPSGSSQEAGSTPSPSSAISPASKVKELMKGGPKGGGGSSTAPSGTGSGGCAGEEGEWMDVAHTSAAHISTNHAYKINCVLSNLPPDSEAHFVGPFAAHGVQVELNPLEHYKFRVAGVNATGVGPWSEVLTYRAVTPGAQGLPTNIKVGKTLQGILISWEPPFVNSSETVYTVLLALDRAASFSSLSPKDFETIYRGPDRACRVSREQLARAKIDRNGEPCAIFRITAKTGNLQATIQVRWLQDQEEPAKKGKEDAGKN